MTRDKRVYNKAIKGYLKLSQEQRDILSSIDGISKEELLLEIERRDAESNTWQTELLNQTPL